MSVLAMAIPALISAGTSIYGALTSGKQNSAAEAELRGQKQRLDNWYNKNYYSDYLQRAENQSLLRNLRETIGRQNQAANQTAVITGATPEQQAAVKEKSNTAIADVYSQIGAMGAKYKEGLDNTYMNGSNNISNAYIDLYNGKAKNADNLTSAGLSALVSAGPEMAKMIGK
ncbi:MAG: hypothetical protein LBS07_05810 [Prevotellaceae bacterium]|jgi:ABC-type uncharacterized transport system substrate-binding protein|nr:hypothetical protein [Prevotellaceae bacterium]